MATHFNALETSEGMVHVLTKTRWAGIFPMPHTSVMPHSGAELKRLGTLIKWNTKEAALLSTLHQGIVRLVEQVGISGIREIANSARMTDRVAKSFADLAIADRSMIWNSDLMEALELQNLLEQAVVALHSAENRTESRGAHARDDFPERDDENWLKHTVGWLDGDGKVTLGYRPVHLNTLSNEVHSIPPKARSY